MEKTFEVDRVPYGLAVHDKEEEEAVLEVIRNHQTIMGEKVKEFEDKFQLQSWNEIMFPDGPYRFGNCDQNILRQ